MDNEWFKNLTSRRIIKGAKFVPFDSTHEFPDHCFFRLKSRGHVFNIPHSAMLALDEPVVLQENGAIKRGGAPADQVPIDKFMKAKRVKQVTKNKPVLVNIYSNSGACCC